MTKRIASHEMFANADADIDPEELLRLNPRAFIEAAQLLVIDVSVQSHFVKLSRDLITYD